MNPIELVSRNGATRAWIDPHGGGIQGLEVDGCPIVDGYPAGQPAPHAAGAVLFPWPNRVRDGRWRLDGEEQQLTIDEPERNNANHGLVRSRPFDVNHVSPHLARLRISVSGDPGYPFEVDLTIIYRALNDGLHVRTAVENLGTRRAPVALGFHPYLRIGDVPMHDLVLEVPAGQVLDLDERLLPNGSRPAEPRHLSLSGAVLNHCYGGLDVVDGQIHHRLRAPDGRCVELRADETYRWLQVYTCPDVPRAGELTSSSSSVALEPLTSSRP
ncbi:aldose epimerase family protein [Kineosporia babensis]|uniref:Aldose 1-epimerase n=1 Tax=Kineosporia babensis TaxID=499548 RepID=A0A9X1NDR1_9ACTN|nr:hypothetical protein [Kineosporia babensis]